MPGTIAGGGAVSNLASVGAAVAVTAGAGAVITTGSAAVVGVTAIGAGVAAVGVGDLVHNVIQEHWADDWHQYGFLDGSGHGVVDSLDQTRHDLAHRLELDHLRASNMHHAARRRRRR